jgi:hypothetical protein
LLKWDKVTCQNGRLTFFAPIFAVRFIKKTEIKTINKKERIIKDEQVFKNFR